MEFWASLIGGLIFSCLVGIWIGNMRGRPGDGALFSLLLGPIGWLIILIGPDYRPKCPECRGVIEEGVRRCKNCGVDLMPAAHRPVARIKSPNLAARKPSLKPGQNFTFKPR